jgi:hypothetical protein
MSIYVEICICVCVEMSVAVPGEAITKGNSTRYRWLRDGTCRLMRTAGGADAVSIMQTADVAKSDLDLAVLMLRCGESNAETLVILVRPFPPRARPKNHRCGGRQERGVRHHNRASGSGLRLPREATSLAAKPSQSSTELTVEVDDQNPIHGVISLESLGPAYPMLMTNYRKP